MTPSRLFTIPLPTISVTSPVLYPTVTPEDEESDLQLSTAAMIIISGVAGIVVLFCICIICLCVKGRR